MTRTQQLVALAATAVFAITSTLQSTAATGVCYSPFHSASFVHDDTAAIQHVLATDLAQIAHATRFTAIRTSRAQFDGVRVIEYAIQAGLRVALGIQMTYRNGSTASVADIEQDIAAAIAAATMHPDAVVAIYAGDENLQDDAASATTIIDVITRVKQALAGTNGAAVPVGTAQRLDAWLASPDAARIVDVSDVAGVNLHPFERADDAEQTIQQTLETQWTLATAAVGPKARVTAIHWPTPARNNNNDAPASVATAQAFYRLVSDWNAQRMNNNDDDAFYFTMFDDDASDKQDFGLATAAGALKFALVAPSEESVPTTNQSVLTTNQSVPTTNQSVTNANESVPTTNQSVTIKIESVALTNESVLTTNESMTNANESVTLTPVATKAVINDVADESDRSLDAGFGPLTTTEIDSSTKPTAWPVPVASQSRSPPVDDVSSAIGSAASSLSTDDATHNNNSNNTTNATNNATHVVPTTVDEAATLPSFIRTHAPLDPSTSSGSGESDERPSAGSGSFDDAGASHSSSSSSNASPTHEPNVGDLPINNAPVVAPDVSHHATFVPVSFAPAASAAAAAAEAKEKEIQALEARAQRERDISGRQGGAFGFATAGIGLVGVAAIVVIAVYMHKRRTHERGSSTRLSITSIDPRESTPSVYNDPLGTRFSSIVMITPNGDGVCIL